MGLNKMLNNIKKVVLQQKRSFTFIKSRLANGKQKRRMKGNERERERGGDVGDEKKR